MSEYHKNDCTPIKIIQCEKLRGLIFPFVISNTELFKTLIFHIFSNSMLVACNRGESHQIKNQKSLHMNFRYNKKSLQEVS